jgi:hypothetical protein
MQFSFSPRRTLPIKSWTSGCASASVEELVEEGNSFEASIVDGVENAKDPDVSEVTTRQVPEDDVPEEYRNDNDRVA